MLINYNFSIEIYNKVGSSGGSGSLHYICTEPSAVMNITDNAWHRLSLNPGHGNLQQDTTPGDYGLTLKDEYYSNCTWKITFGASYYQQAYVLFVSLRLSNEDGSIVSNAAGGNQVWADSNNPNQYSTVFNQTFAIRPSAFGFTAGSRIYLEICHPAVGSYPSNALNITGIEVPYIYDFEVIPD